MKKEKFKNYVKNLESNGKRIILEFGPGEVKKFTDSISIDCVEKGSVDIVHDLSNGLEFIPDSSVDIIYSSHFLEHVEDLEGLMIEIHRVLKSGGKKIGAVPHFSNPYFYSDYTHKNFWGMYTLLYFSNDRFFKREVPRYYNQLDFRINEINLNFSSPFLFRKIFRKVFGKIINTSKFLQEFYEENLTGFISCYEIYFVIEKK